MSSETQSTKRKLPENANFKARKKQKQADARTIPVQIPQVSQNAVAGPSTSDSAYLYIWWTRHV